EEAAALEAAPAQEQDVVAVDETTGAVDGEAAVGVAVEGEAEIVFAGVHARREPLEVEGAAVEVDVAAVRRIAHGVDGRAEVAEDRRRDVRGRAVRAVEQEAEPREARAREEPLERFDVAADGRAVLGRTAGPRGWGGD